MYDMDTWNEHIDRSLCASIYRLPTLILSFAKISPGFICWELDLKTVHLDGYFPWRISTFCSSCTCVCVGGFSSWLLLPPLGSNQFKTTHYAGVWETILPGGCVGVLSSVVFLAVIVGGTTVPAAFMCRVPGGLILFVGSDFWEVLWEMSAGVCSRPVTYAATRLAGCRDPMFPSNSLAWLYDLPFTWKGRNTNIILFKFTCQVHDLST